MQGGSNQSAKRPIKRRRSRASRRSPEVVQREQFERGTKLFQGHKYAAARRMMEKVVAGPDPCVSHRAGVYLSICRNRRKRSPLLETVEDHYNRGVELLNNGKLTDAVRVLNKGLAKDPGSGDLYYLKCVARALGGKTNLASKDLGRAIEIDSNFRSWARRDPDLRAVIDSPQFTRVVGDSVH